MSIDLIIGWILGLLSSLLTGIVMYWLEGQREERREQFKRRSEQIRVALNWSSDGKKASLRGFDLRGANLSGKDLSGADLESANLEGIGGWSLNLNKANLRAVNFRGAKIKYSSFQGAVIKKADFADVVLVEVDFSGADMREADFSRAKSIEKCIWSGVKLNERTKLRATLKEEIDKQQSTDQGEVKQEAAQSSQPVTNDILPAKTLSAAAAEQARAADRLDRGDFGSRKQ